MVQCGTVWWEEGMDVYTLKEYLSAVVEPTVLKECIILISGGHVLADETLLVDIIPSAVVTMMASTVDEKRLQRYASICSHQHQS